MEAISRWIKAHPVWFAPECRIDFLDGEGEGWSELVDKTLARIERMLATEPGVTPRIVQIKSKIGAVRIYCRLDNASDDFSEAISDVVNDAVIASETICEPCGAAKPPCLTGQCACQSLPKP